jgi:predicted transcriptional regulator
MTERQAFIVDRMLEGHTISSIAGLLELTSSRVSQILYEDIAPLVLQNIVETDGG